ncbi:MAG: carbon starvation protein A [Kiritimatiellae bacterium]|nr:carbon starvation protein A [Kiritimatiellia bacterium]
MPLLILILAGCGAFALAYRYYGAFLERRMGVRRDRATPAHTRADGVDFVPTQPALLFGHHFSSIAGAGPIVGPVIASFAFGWAPAVAWIVLGAIFVGGVHDFTAMISSLRHEGRSIGEICRERTGVFTYNMMLVFILLTLVYVIIVFLDLTAASFAPAIPAGMTADRATALLREGGAVATASLAYIGLAVVFGLLLYRFNLPLGRLTLVFVPIVLGMVALGLKFPLHTELVPTFMGSSKHYWSLVLLFYCFIASVLPVWVLLQPRDFLSSFLLYACLGGGMLGLIVTSLSDPGAAAIRYPAWIGWSDPHLGLIFPAIFITIACGAVSGFHSIVASGTSSKQLDLETSARPVAYGAMLVEGVLALLAVATVMILPKDPGRTPVAVFADGLGTFFSHLGLSVESAKVFALLSVSTFLLTTLDTCTRLARMILQELFRVTTRPGTRFLATLAVLAIPSWAVFQDIPGPDGRMMSAWNAIWPAFGATNQLLAALALLVVFVWLRASGHRALYAGIPAVFMCGTTLSALVQLVHKHLIGGGSQFVGVVSAALLALAIAVILSLVRALARLRSSPPRSSTPA